MPSLDDTLDTLDENDGYDDENDGYDGEFDAFDDGFNKKPSNQTHRYNENNPLDQVMNSSCDLNFLNHFSNSLMH